MTMAQHRSRLARRRYHMIMPRPIGRPPARSGPANDCSARGLSHPITGANIPSPLAGEGGPWNAAEITRRIHGTKTGNHRVTEDAEREAEEGTFRFQHFNPRLLNSRFPLRVLRDSVVQFRKLFRRRSKGRMRGRDRRPVDFPPHPACGPTPQVGFPPLPRGEKGKPGFSAAEASRAEHPWRIRPTEAPGVISMGWGGGL